MGMVASERDLAISLGEGEGRKEEGGGRRKEEERGGEKRREEEREGLKLSMRSGQALMSLGMGRIASERDLAISLGGEGEVRERGGERIEVERGGRGG
jgi:hypothetical protein